VKVATVDEVPAGQGKVIEVNGMGIAIFNAGGGKFFASGSVCPHEDGPLGEGVLEGDTVICPSHGFDFDLKCGDCLVDPELKVTVYPVKVEGSDIYVETP
jgi:nitrite reductase/ring-hydroxylating ferredoxin subunit